MAWCFSSPLVSQRYPKLYLSHLTSKSTDSSVEYVKHADCSKEFSNSPIRNSRRCQPRLNIVSFHLFAYFDAPRISTCSQPHGSTRLNTRGCPFLQFLGVRMSASVKVYILLSHVEMLTSRAWSIYCTCHYGCIQGIILESLVHVIHDILNRDGTSLNVSPVLHL